MSSPLFPVSFPRLSSKATKPEAARGSAPTSKPRAAPHRRLPALAGSTTPTRMTSSNYTLWGVPLSLHVLLFSHANSGYQLGCTIAAVSAQPPGEHVKNDLQNIRTERTPQSVIALRLGRTVMNYHGSRSSVLPTL